ncbi:MAG: alpha/beta fold hydrolase [Fimbriimonadaceae bacterium]|nr:alpha/beta fold hydrolase [Fimbriimonadaceae bacterium]
MSGIHVEERRLGDLPYRIVTNAARPGGPVILVQHGYTGSLETETPYGVRFAEAGFRAVVTEADLHGLRKPADFEDRFASDFGRTMGAVVETALRELTALLDHLGVERAGIFGISMGGFIAYRMASEDPRIVVACPVISQPFSYWSDLVDEPDRSRIAARCAFRNPDRLSRCALLMQNGEDDEVLPIGQTRALVEALRPMVAPDRLRFIAYPGVGHEVTPAMVDEAVTWFEKHLPP